MSITPSTRRQNNKTVTAGVSSFTETIARTQVPYGTLQCREIGQRQRRVAKKRNSIASYEFLSTRRTSLVGCCLLLRRGEARGFAVGGGGRSGVWNGAPAGSRAQCNKRSSWGYPLYPKYFSLVLYKSCDWPWRRVEVSTPKPVRSFATAIACCLVV